MRQLVTREDYHDAAMRILGTQGAGGLKITALCRELGVTTGSFYGYFDSLDGFIDEFLQFWWESQTARMADVAVAPEDPVERIQVTKTLASTVPHAAEGAIRAWASTNPAVAEMQAKVDKRRAAVLTEILRPATGNAKEARTLGVMAMTLLVGLQQWRQPITARDVNLVFDEFEKLVLLNMERSSV